MKSIKKVLLVRFSSIGDMVLTSPAVRCIKQQMPGVQLHYLTKKQYEPLLVANPYIDKIFTIEKKVDEVLLALKAENYDYVVDLHKNLRSMQVKRGLGVAAGSFNKLNVQKWLLTNFEINLLPQLHIVDRYFGALRKLGVENDGRGLDYFIAESDRIVVVDFLPERFTNGYVVLVMGSKQATKQIPHEKMMEIVDRLNKPVVLLGGPEDFTKAKLLAEALGNKVFNACGVLNVNQSASIIQQGLCVITPDTGMMHIAAALKKKIISVWGNTIPGFGMYPYFPKGEENYRIVEVLNLNCRPCSKLGYKACPQKHFKCMRNIDVSEIMGATGL
ncbi:MAG: glycosyltransferase family 9 protein [Bacteroidota bacterium]